ncbi:MAG TPA: histidine kinase dimerization/phospho-acceptor domain-containing protein, partial [Solirubrobacteraceae bacterium]|nr:histidine kinase dimerization/phospho-acceptor domain-containing protein [Solirubrobacteraceae bacterium]
MSLRTRIAATASLSVALAVLVAASALYLAVRSELRGEIDRSLRRRAAVFLLPVPDGFPSPRTENLGPSGDAPQRGLPSNVRPAPFGDASGYVQFISPTGALEVPSGQGDSTQIAPSPSDRAIAASGQGSSLSDRTVRGTSLRVLTLGVGPRGAVMIARPLTEVQHELGRILLILLLIGLAGIALAAVLGTLVARTALAPIARFTRRTETLTGKLDLSQRLPDGGRDELGRLAHSFNLTLDALERSVQAQRHLVADASHELRTPITSLRANIQTLAEAERLSEEEQRALRHDILEELDELTALVSDLVELARGGDPTENHVE